MNTTERITTLCRKCRNLVDATRIWNWIDCQPEPEPLWSIMAREVPWAFFDPANVNSVRFTYRGEAYPPADPSFRDYAATRARVLKRIREIYCYVKQLERVVKAIPGDRDQASVVDLDNLQSLDHELTVVADRLCDWDALDLEYSRLGLAVK